MRKHLFFALRAGSKWQRHSLILYDGKKNRIKRISPGGLDTGSELKARPDLFSDSCPSPMDAHLPLGAYHQLSRGKFLAIHEKFPRYARIFS